MAVQECTLMLNGEEYGVALVDTTTGRPLPISRNWLTDLDDATAFLEWHEICQGIELSELDAAQLDGLGKEWAEGDRARTQCIWKDCSARQNGSGICDDHEREHNLIEANHDREWLEGDEY